MKRSHKFMSRNFPTGILTAFLGFRSKKEHCGPEIRLRFVPVSQLAVELSGPLFLTGLNGIGTVFHAPLTKLEADLVTILKSKCAGILLFY